MPLTHIWIWILLLLICYITVSHNLYIERVNSLETLERTVFFANRYCDYPINLVPTVIERGKNSYNSYSRLLFQFVPKVSRRIHYSLRYSTCVRLFGTMFVYEMETVVVSRKNEDKNISHGTPRGEF